MKKLDGNFWRTLWAYHGWNYDLETGVFCWNSWKAAWEHASNYRGRFMPKHMDRYDRFAWSIEDRTDSQGESA